MWDVIVVAPAWAAACWAIRSLGQAAECCSSRRALHAARDAGHDSLFDAGAGRAAGDPFHRDLLRRPGPGRALHRRDRRHQQALLAAVFAVHRQRDRGVVGPLRHGLRAIFRSRFHSPANFRDPGDSTVPEAWPITYDQLPPWYAEAEKLLRVRGQPDPLRPEAAAVSFPAAPPFSADNQPLVDYLAGRGLHPYHLPMACDYTDGCTTCQSYLCHQSCKNEPPAMACYRPLPSTAPSC